MNKFWFNDKRYFTFYLLSNKYVCFFTRQIFTPHIINMFIVLSKICSDRVNVIKFLYVHKICKARFELL
jgi:hypothetical protein